jgi:hypothetical protein
VQRLVGRLVAGLVEVDARRADQLADDDTLGAVDDEGAFGVIIGKSPMNTVWLLISPVLLLMNSAVTNSGAAYVMSLSLHSSTGALTSSKRGSLNDSDIDPEKSSIGDSSVSTSSSPPTGFTSPRAVATSRQCSEPTSHSKDWV